jgi:ABC-2 type transport system ATP-binding protein
MILDDTVKYAVSARSLSRTFTAKFMPPVKALDDVSLSIPEGSLTAIVGPDGAGKTTLLRLLTGLLSPDAGTLRVLGLTMPRDAEKVQSLIGYMPQKFGLYEDLSVEDNLDLYADLHGVGKKERKDRFDKLLAMTALAPFTKRLAGKLSGGMKQKLGLACTLVRLPKLLILDEPTVGVDPLSRRELWSLVFQLVKDEKLPVIVSTSYMDEAARCGHVIVMRKGKIAAEGLPWEIAKTAEGTTYVATPPVGLSARDFQARIMDIQGVVDAVPEGGAVRVVMPREVAAKSLPGDIVLSPVPPRLEDGFMTILSRAEIHAKIEDLRLERTTFAKADATVIEVRDLLRTFGTFTAVNHTNFIVKRGEVFGLLGPNGAGKTTTFRMLCGLLPASGGLINIAGANLRTARADARNKLGYVAQKFSLYGQISVMENLEFFARAYGLHGDRKTRRINWALENFELATRKNQNADSLPGGFKQRLSMAAALLHEPEILFLDEPTSGADPLARREFWRRITSLSQQGVTIVVTTHFMEEAEYCDHIVIMDAGSVIAHGTPAEVRKSAEINDAKATMEDAFISIVENRRAANGNGGAK